MSYRFWLERDIQDEGLVPQVTFVMLNPSTADEVTDDPTIRRCKKFALDWSCQKLVVVNLFAWRATHPNQLRDCPMNEQVGEGAAWGRAFSNTDGFIVAAWGALAPEWLKELAQPRVETVVAAIGDSTIWCLGTTKSGSPRHPLYVKGDTELIEWRAE